MYRVFANASLTPVKDMSRIDVQNIKKKLEELVSKMTVHMEDGLIYSGRSAEDFVPHQQFIWFANACEEYEKFPVFSKLESIEILLQGIFHAWCFTSHCALRKSCIHYHTEGLSRVCLNEGYLETGAAYLYRVSSVTNFCDR